MLTGFMAPYAFGSEIYFHSDYVCVSIYGYGCVLTIYIQCAKIFGHITVSFGYIFQTSVIPKKYYHFGFQVTPIDVWNNLSSSLVYWIIGFSLGIFRDFLFRKMVARHQDSQKMSTCQNINVFKLGTGLWKLDE